MQKKSTETIVFIVLFSVTIVILFVLMVIILVDLARIQRLEKALAYTLDNNNVCPQRNEGVCELVVDPLMPVPAFPSSFNEYDRAVATYATNIIAGIEFPWANKFANKNDIITIDTSSLVGNIVYDKYIIGTVVTTGDVAWLSFKGTTTKEEWQQDFKIQQTTSKSIAGLAVSNKTSTSTCACAKQAISSVETTTDGLSFEGKVHTGFLEIYNTVREQVLQLLVKSQSKRLVIAGHSLGAALATLASTDTEIPQHTSSVCYAIACPRVGNQAFADSVASQKNVYRIINEADIIPTLPPTVSPNFKDNPDVYIYASSGQLVSFNDNRQSFLQNHILPVYLKFLQS